MSDEEIAAQAAAEAMGETDEGRDLKRKERLEQNRVSARESRKRKKQMIEGEFVPNCSAVCAGFCLPGSVMDRKGGACPLASDLDRTLLILLHSFFCGRIDGCCDVIGRILHIAHHPILIIQSQSLNNNIAELQRTVITLSRDNKELNEKNEELRRQLMDIGAKVRDGSGASAEFKPSQRPNHHRSEGRQERSRSTQRNGVGNVTGFFRW